MGNDKDGNQCKRKFCWSVLQKIGQTITSTDASSAPYSNSSQLKAGIKIDTNPTESTSQPF